LLAEMLRARTHDQIFALLRPGRRATDCLQALRAAVVALSADADEPPSLDRVIPIQGDVRHPDLGLSGPDQIRLRSAVDVIVHAAAMTRFSAPLADLRLVNVQGTRHALELARRCSRLEQFLLVSTTCVAGTATGSIAETVSNGLHGFVNAYERTKSESEHVAMGADLPVRVARLSTCVGGERTGYVHRFGAVHRLLYWLTRGLLPMIPAVGDARMDFITTDMAARWIARAVSQPVDRVDVCHLAAGDRAVPAGEVLHCAVGYLRTRFPEWRNRHIETPAIVDAETFGLFARAAADTGDVLLARVLEAAATFLPALLYPKVYETTRAERVWGAQLQLSDWRSVITKAIDFGTACNWRPRAAKNEYV
jgi:thioester reductase-like protein